MRSELISQGRSAPAVMAHGYRRRAITGNTSGHRPQQNSKRGQFGRAQVRDRRLCNFKPEHQQLTVIPGRTPQWAFGTHPPDQVTKTPINFRPPCPVFGFPAPKHPKNRTVPSKNSLRLNQPGISTKFGQSLVIITSNARSPPLNRNAMVLAAARC